MTVATVTTEVTPVVAPEEVPTHGQPTPIANTLDKAADLLEKGWMQELLFNEERTSFCAVGAVGYVHNIHPNMLSHSTEKLNADKALVFLAAHLGLNSTGIGIGQRNQVVYWNNDPAQTQEQVVAAFRGAALEAYTKGV